MISNIRSFQALLLALLLSSAFAACTSRELPEHSQATFTIPQLKARPASLSPNEFKTYRGKYDELAGKIHSNPNDVAAYVEMAQLFMAEARISGDHPYYYPAAKQLLDRALSIAPNDLNALISLGSIQLSLHQFKEAAETGKKAIAIAPYSNLPWGILCDASVELGDYRTAIFAADSMVAIRPDLRSYARVSYLREVHGDINGAIEAMDMAVKAGVPGREEKAWARNTLGTIYLNHGELKKAEKEFQLALAERPNYAFALAGLARVQVAQKHFDAAISLLDSASALVPEFSFLQLKADIMRVKGDLTSEQRLIAEIEKGLSEDEASGHAMDREFAMLYATRGIKAETAERYARKEFQKRPNSIDAQYTLALACLRSNKLDEACALIQMVLEKQPRNAEHLAIAGLIANARDDRSLASKYWNDALAVSPFLSPLLLTEIHNAQS